MTEFKRHFTKPGQPAIGAWRYMRWKDIEIEAPASWSDNAIEIAASKYFRHKDGETSVRQLMALRTERAWVSPPSRDESIKRGASSLDDD